MAKLGNKNTKKPYELIKAIQAPTGITPTLTLIANYRGYLRFLISENLSTPNGNDSLELKSVVCVSRVPRWIRTEFVASSYDRILIRRRDNLCVVQTKRGSIFPLPSKRPYNVLGLEYSRYRYFKGLADPKEPGKLEALVERLIATTASIEGFFTKTSGWWFWERTGLVTPEDYANQYSYWKALKEKAGLR